MRSNCGRTALRSIRRSTPTSSTLIEPTTSLNNSETSFQSQSSTTSLSSQLYVHNTATSSLSAVFSSGFSAYTPQPLLQKTPPPNPSQSSSSLWAAHSKVEHFVDRVGFRVASQLPPRWRQLTLKVTKSLALTWGVVMFCVVIVGGSRLFMDWYLRNFTTLDPIGTAAARRRLRRDLMFKHGLECHCSACKAAGLGMGAAASPVTGGDSESSITLHHHAGGTSYAPTSAISSNITSTTMIMGGGRGSGGGGDMNGLLQGMCRTPLLLWVSEEHPVSMAIVVMVMIPLLAEVGVASWFHSRSRRYNTHMASLLQAQLKRNPPPPPSSSSSPLLTTKHLDAPAGSSPVVAGRSGTKRRRYAPQSKWATLKHSNSTEVATTVAKPVAVAAPLVSTLGEANAQQGQHPSTTTTATPDHWGRARGLKLFRKLLLAQMVYTHSHLVSLVLVGLMLEAMYIIALLQ